MIEAPKDSEIQPPGSCRECMNSDIRRSDDFEGEDLGNERSLRWAALLLGLFVLPAAVLWPFRNVEFLADDVFFGPGFSVGSRTALWYSAWPHSMGLTKAWRPLVELTYLLQGDWSSQPVPYHLFNYFLHGLNAVLLAILVKQVTRKALAGFVAGMLFCVHPIVHENIQWISGRTYPLAATFALLLSVWSVDGKLRPWIRQHAIGVALLVGALASYEFSVVVPLAILSVTYVAWRGRGEVDTYRMIVFIAPYAATVVGYFTFRWLFLTSLNADIVVAARASQWLPIGPITYRVPTNATFATLRLLAWPWFERWSDIRVGMTGLFTTIVVACSAAVLFVRSRRRQDGAIWILWSVLFYLPISAAAAFSDRFGYLSAAGVAALVGAATAALYEQGSVLKRCASIAVIITLAISWSADLRAHARDWQQAGRIATKLLSQLRAQERVPTEQVSLYFIDLPVRYHSAILFLTYFPLSVQKSYPEESHRYLDIIIATAAEDVVLRDAEASGAAHASVYRWHAETEELTRVWTRDTRKHE